MAVGISGRTQETPPKERRETLDHKIILEDVVVRERTVIVDVPKVEYKPIVVEYEKPVITEKETIKYNVVEKETVRYNTVNQDTIKYNTIEVPTERPVTVTKEYEKPIVVEKVYEKPVITEKEYIIHSVKNIEDIKSFVETVKSLNQELPALLENLKKLKEYRLVEQIVRVPKVEYETVKVERIEWVPVKREKEGLLDAS